MLSRPIAAAVAAGLAGCLAGGPAWAAGAAPRAAPVAAPVASAARPQARAAGPESIGAQARSAEQAQLNAIDVPGAWKLSKGSGVTVGVLDTGVATGVADLSGSVSWGPDYTLGADPAGYQPPHLHGTFIASIVAAHGSGAGRAGGIVGVAPAATVLSVRVILDDQEPGLAVYNTDPEFANAIARGVQYAVQHGVGVINMSLGSDQPTRELQAAIADAVSHGIVVVASAGNSGTGGHALTPYSYPAAFTGVISVAAATAGGSRASFSDRNSSVVISAPGVNVVGDGPDGTFLEASGTSPASAFVAGVAALIRSAYPRLSPAQVEQAIITSATHRPAGGYSPATGFGEVNAAAAVRAAGQLAAVKPDTGVAAGAHFGGRPGPIEVVHRDKGRIRLLAGLGGVAALGFLAALVAVVLLTVAAVRGRRRTAALAPPGVPAGFGPPAGPSPDFPRPAAMPTDFLLSPWELPRSAEQAPPPPPEPSWDAPAPAPAPAPPPAPAPAPPPAPAPAPPPAPAPAPAEDAPLPPLGFSWDAPAHPDDPPEPAPESDTGM